MKNIDNDVFDTEAMCILPWIHFHALPNKKVLPCCMAESSLPVSNTEKTSVIEMMNTEEYKQLRLNMLNNVKSEVCKRCYDVEELGTWSLRKSQNMVRGDRNFDLVQSTNDDGSIDEFKLKYMDIRWSNICNFKCRSCGPEFSSLHAKEYAEKKWSKDHLKTWFKMDDIVVTCNDDNSLIEKITPYLDSVEEVYFAGGEALITPEHYDLLDYWIEHDLADVIDLSYTTNFSVFKFKDKNIIDYWKKFGSVKLYASLDGDKALAEYLRKGTKWRDIVKNALMIQEKVPHVELNLTPTISIWNVMRFPDFIDEWRKLGYINHKTEIRLNILTHPWYANIQILPEFYRKKAFDKWMKLRMDEYYSRDVRNSVANVMNALRPNADDWGTANVDGLKEFFDDNFATDKMRNDNLFKSIPELEEVYKWTMQNLSK